MGNAHGSTLTRRRALVGVGSGVAVLGAAALGLRGRGHGRHALVGGTTLIRGNLAEPDSLDPHRASATYELSIIGEMFLGLMTENAAGEPVMGAAESYRVSGDGLTYTFRLRDHQWSDGTTVTAEDFVYSFRRILDSKTASPYGNILYPIQNAQAVNANRAPPESLAVRALDSRTLEISFCVHVPYVAQLLAHFSTYPVPRQVIERHGEGWTRPGVLVSNGAYRLKEWVPNDHIALERNPRFYDVGRVRIERVIVRPTPDYPAALTAYRAGELDIDVIVPSQTIGWVRRNLPAEIHVTPYMETFYVLFNVRAPQIRDIRVRTALSLAIDRESLTGRVMNAGEMPAYSLVPPRMPNYPGTAGLRFRGLPMSERRAHARKLLADAGYGPSNRLALDFNINNPTTIRLVAVALQSMWKEIGADVRIVPSDEKDHYNLLLKQEYSFAWGGWTADFLDAENFLMLGQSSAPELNNTGYSNPRFDALIARADRISDPVARGTCLAEAEQMLLDDGAIAPVYFGVARALVSPAVKGWIDNDRNVHRIRWLSLDRRYASA